MQFYRTDIEGLRALAVILVIAYHYQFPGITGGFVGVDVFFVISGHVITQLLMRALDEGTFSFGTFYSRRIRRLVPAFLLASTCTFLMISPYYLDEDYYIFAKSWLASLAGLSNFYYLSELNQYFAPEAQSLSLLHTWSLAVEEQFYLFWPLLMLLSWPILKTRWGRWLFVVLWLAAFALSIHLANHSAAAAYYLLPARIFELLLGAAIALFAASLPSLTRWMAETLSAIGLTLITGTALLLTSSDHFPGYNALWPTLGCALLLYAGLKQPDTLIARLLSLRIMVFLGGISYSLYLWHWPPIALLHYQLIELTWPNRLALLGGVVLLSWLSFRFVENRIRRLDWNFRKSFLVLIFLPALAIWVIQTTIRIADDISFRFPESRRDLYKIIVQANDTNLYKRCFKGDTFHFDQSQACLFGTPTVDGKPNSILIGDSHAIALTGFIEEMLAGTDLYMLLVTRASTPFVLARDAAQAFAGNQEKIDRSEALTQYLSAGRPMKVFIGAYWDAYLQNPDYQGYFTAAVEWLIAQGHEVIMLEDVPRLPSSAYAHCLLNNLGDCSISVEPVLERLKAFNRFKAELQQRYPHLLWINPRSAICDETRCDTVLNGIPLYRDESHLNNLGAREIAKQYLVRYGNPLLPKHLASSPLN